MVIRFVEAVEDNETEELFALLARDVQARIDYEQLARANGDFQGIVEAFRQADITTRSKDELPNHVSKLGGREGALLFVVIQENGEWKIANVLERPENAAH